MSDDFLKIKLQRVIRRFWWVALWRKLAATWAAAALIALGVVFLQRELGWSAEYVRVILAVVGVVAVVGVFLHHLTRSPDPRWVAQKIEAKHPELQGVLLTAVQQDLTANTEPNFLQHLVVQQATAHSQQADWRKVVPSARLAVGQLVHLVGLACFVLALAGVKVVKLPTGEKPAWVGSDGLAITPGDTQIEKGDSLVVLARFSGALPPTVTLVVRENGVAPRSIPLVKSLADPVFGGSVPEVASDLTYQLEYRGQKTREFKVKVFEHPKLIRSDVALTFPDYTKLQPKRIEDTRRVSAVEGTKLDFSLQLNKPVKAARLVSRDKKTTIPLEVSADKALATLTGHVPEKTQSYDLQLVDEEGRANKVAAPFSIDVQPNRPPEIKLAAPRGDVRPSALEEVTFDGSVWDDFGSPRYGLAYSIAGAAPKDIELGRDLPGKEKRGFGHMIKLEDLGAKADDLVSWYAWAEDIGPDGKVRRTSTDLFFAEVRPFDEIFRESQNMESDEQQQGGGGGGQQARRLTELQKQIINATWKLQREGLSPKYEEDAKVVRDAQQSALQQAAEQMAEARSPRDQATWKEATQEMVKALSELDAALKTPGPLAEALPAEQAAYQALLKMQARETNVTRRQRQQGGGGGGDQANQRQLDQLDLQQSENRYETQRQARAPQNQERREQLAVMNRLQELARRQQDLNERLKELQTALQAADTEQEKEEIRRRLKRLQEEQQQMLADADEVRQRMDRAENQSSMSEQRQQLDQTREDLQKAAEAANQGSVAQALASGTRAQRQLQQMRDDMRKQNSNQFADEMREMRNEARDLSRKQEELGQKLDQLANQRTQRRSLSESGDRKEVLDQLTEQRDRMRQLVDRATQVSEQAENTEPLLSRQLYDSIRKASQDDANSIKEARDDLVSSGALSFDLRERLQKAGDSENGGKALDITRNMLEEGALPQASRAGQRARAGVDEFRKGVERAAESVLGDDAEQLKLAQSELDQLTDQLRRESAQAGQAGGQEGQQENGNQRGGQQQGNQGDRQAGNQPGQGQQGQQGQQGDSQQAQSGEGQQPGESQSGQEGQDGQQPGQRGQGSRQLAQSGKQGQRGQQGQQGQEGQQGGQSGQGEQEGQQSGQGGGRSEAQAQNQAAGGGGSGGSENQNQTGTDRLANGNNPSERLTRAQQAEREVERLRAERDALLRQQKGLTRGGSREGGRGLGVNDLLNGGFENGGVGGGDFGGNRYIGGGPLTGEDFVRWEQRLRDVEDLVDAPDLRNAVANAREQARQLRRDFKQDLKKPDWTKVQLQIIKPLVEVRTRVAEELARRDSKESLAPIDRDPVPNRFAEGVRRYYEELGKDK